MLDKLRLLNPFRESTDNKYYWGEVAGGGKTARVALVSVDYHLPYFQFEFPEGKLVDPLANFLANGLDLIAHLSPFRKTKREEL